MTKADTSSYARTVKIRQAAKRSFVAALTELEPEAQHAIVSDIMQANNLESTTDDAASRLATQETRLDWQALNLDEGSRVSESSQVNA